MNLFEMASLPPIRLVPQAAAPAGSQERGKDELLFKLLQLESDTLDHLVRLTGWDRATIHKSLLQLVADGKVRCTNQRSLPHYSVRDEWKAEA